MAHKMISCFRGLAPVSMPEEWLEGFDTNNSFGSAGDEARIRFPNGKAFGVRVEHNRAEVSRYIHALSAEEIASTRWGKFGPPWESYETSRLFGHGPVTRLDEM